MLHVSAKGQFLLAETTTIFFFVKSGILSFKNILRGLHLIFVL